jgi:hypothetical protein
VRGLRGGQLPRALEAVLPTAGHLHRLWDRVLALQSVASVPQHRVRPPVRIEVAVNPDERLMFIIVGLVFLVTLASVVVANL